jgi:predicted flap endonuclease-1-like 5' DNA nuclease
MDLIREYWWLILAAVVVIGLLVVLLRPRQRVQLTDSAPVRPHMAQSAPPEGRGIVSEAAAATVDIAGQVLAAPVHGALDGTTNGGDDLSLLKGVGPKFADALRAVGFQRFDQLARLTPAEIERLDAQLGAFRGRIARDRIVEQADYLARGDIDGFEQRFGKLTS